MIRNPELTYLVHHTPVLRASPGLRVASVRGPKWVNGVGLGAPVSVRQ